VVCCARKGNENAVTLAELLVLTIVHRNPSIHLARAARAVLSPPLDTLHVSSEAARAAINDLRQRGILTGTATPRGLELALTTAGAREFCNVLLALQQVSNTALTVAAVIEPRA
jgi:hypothetical protein